MQRAEAEHWTGRLYMRHVSIYVTRLLLPTGISANGVTALFIATGLLAAAVTAVPGLVAAIGAMLLAQLHMLLDCADGEVARWRRTSSPKGVYLDRIGHYATEAAIVAALGVRADGGVVGGWTTVGLLGAVLVLFNKAETDLVHVSRAFAGMPRLTDGAKTIRPAALRGLRRLVGLLPFHRVLAAIEMTALLVLAAIVDAAAGSLIGTRGLLVALVGIAGVVLVGHLVSILTSDRLR